MYDSKNERPFNERPLFSIVQSLRVDKRFGGIQHAVGEAPLVVVPAHDFHQTTLNAGLGGIKVGGERAVVKVDGYQRLGVDIQHSVHRRLDRCSGNNLIHLFHAGIASSDEVQVNHGYVGCGNPYRHAGKTALQLRHNQANRFSRTGLGGNHVKRRCTGTVQVSVIDVTQTLVIGVGMDGGHHAAFDTNGVIKRLGHRRQAVGGAGGVGDNGHVCRQDVVVHAINDGCIHVPYRERK